MATRSYADLHASIRKQVREGKVLSDPKSATPGDKINEWVKVSRKCLALMEDRVPTLLREFDSLRFHFRIMEGAEDQWSDSGYRDEGDNAIDFDFSALQHVVELLEWADQKLQLDSEPEAANGPSPKLPAKESSAGGTQEMAADKLAPLEAVLPKGGDSAVAKAGQALSGLHSLGAHRLAVLKPILDAKGFTRSKWAKKAGVDPSVVYDYLSGKSNPNAESRKFLAEAIELPVDKLPK